MPEGHCECAEDQHVPGLAIGGGGRRCASIKNARSQHHEKGLIRGLFACLATRCSYAVSRDGRRKRRVVRGDELAERRSMCRNLDLHVEPARKPIRRTCAAIIVASVLGEIVFSPVLISGSSPILSPVPRVGWRMGLMTSFAADSLVVSGGPATPAGWSA